VIAPALAQGRVVLCDRYADSTLAYQGAGRGLDAAMLAAWNHAATGGLVPALTLLFDVVPDLGLARRQGAPGVPNRLDREPEDFHNRVRQRFIELAQAEPQRWVVLDASLTADELEARVWEAVSAKLPAAARLGVRRA
jgi:dTMP kinase